MRCAIAFDSFGPYHLARLEALGKRLRLLGLEIHGKSEEYGWKPVGGAQSYERVTLGAPWTRRQLVAALKQFAPDVVAVPGWSGRPALVMLDWAVTRGIPVVMMSESQLIDFPRRPHTEWLKRQVLRLCSAGFVGGTAQRLYLQALGIPASVIHEGYDSVDTGYFADGAEAARGREADERARLGLTRKYFLTVNRFIEKKNLAMLLRAYARYRERTSDAWDLILVGDGPLRQELADQRQRLGLDRVVHMPGFLQYEDLPSYYGLTEVFVHASTSEQWGLVVNEALAAAVPVIVSDRCGCAPDLVEEGINGWTFDPSDEDGLVDLLCWSAAPERDRRRMGERGREIVQRWSPEQFAAGLHAAALDARERRVAHSRLRLAMVRLLSYR